MKEIGSEFSLSENTCVSEKTPGWLPCGSDFALTFSGRTAFETVIGDIGNIKKVCFPSYCCGSMVEPFEKASAHVVYYDVDFSGKLQVNLEIPEDCDLLLICNYFGFETDYPEQVLKDFKNRGGIIIEDITHSLLSERQYHLESDYLVASLRKWGALVSGGFCSKMKGRFASKPEKQPSDEYISIKLMAMKLKEEYLRDGDEAKKEKYLNLFGEANGWLVENYSGIAMDEVSRKIISSWNISEMAEQRRKNAKALYKGLGEEHMLFPLCDMDCPLFVPILIQNAEKRADLRKKLTENRIYCPIHWPKPNEKCGSGLYNTELSVICDQRYNEEDMKYITEVIQRVWEG